MRTRDPGREGCAAGAALVAERGPGPRRLPLPSCAREEEERPGGALAAPEGALRCWRGGRDPQVLAPRCPAQPRNRKVHASRFNFWGPRHSPERGASAPTPGEERGESLWALFWPVSLRVGWAAFP